VEGKVVPNSREKLIVCIQLFNVLMHTTAVGMGLLYRSVVPNVPV